MFLLLLVVEELELIMEVAVGLVELFSKLFLLLLDNRLTFMLGMVVQELQVDLLIQVRVKTLNLER